jgi:hypothetical protein
MKIVDIETLAAGPDLDRVIAENIMGWKPYHGYIMGAGDQADWMQRPDDRAYTHKLNIPKFSTEIAWAYRVVEKVMEVYKDRFPSFVLNGFIKFTAVFHLSHPGIAMTQVGSTLPEAICRAALAMAFDSRFDEVQALI